MRQRIVTSCVVHVNSSDMLVKSYILKIDS